MFSGKLLVKIWNDNRETVDRAKEKEKHLRKQGIHAPSREFGQTRSNFSSQAESSKADLESNVTKEKETMEDLENSEEDGTSE